MRRTRRPRPDPSSDQSRGSASRNEEEVPQTSNGEAVPHTSEEAAAMAGGSTSSGTSSVYL